MNSIMEFLEQGGDKRATKKAFKDLNNFGYVITDEIYPNVDIPKNYRVYGRSPLAESDKKCGIITIGPFPIKKEAYEGIINLTENISNTEKNEKVKNFSLSVMLAPYKLQYEYYGVINDFEKITMEEKDLKEIAIFISYIYDLYNPIVTKNFYWIVPDNTKRAEIIKNFGVIKAEHKEYWWNTRMRVINEVDKLDLNQKNDYFMVPSSVILEWENYISDSTVICIMGLYSIGTKNQRHLRFNEEALQKVLNESIMQKYKENFCNNPDKELMLEKLYKNSNIENPNNVNNLYEFLIKTGFLIKKIINGENYYWVAKIKQCKKPEDIFNLDSQFNRTLDLYNKNGSIILDYMTADEYVTLTTDYE